MRWLSLFVLFLLPAPAVAQGWIEPLVAPPGVAATRVQRLRTSVTVRITDRVARVEVEEWFRNAGGGTAEGDYIYPLPGETVFSDFSLFQGEEELNGETMEASRARAIYEEIVRRRRDPALIELAGNGLLRARVFPFGPHETRNVRLRYTQVLDRAGDALRFRYVAGRARPAGATFAPNTAPRDEALLTFTLVAENGKSRVVSVEPFSAAYFKLLEKLPELTPYLSAFDAVIVRGRDVSIRVAAGGSSTLAATELDTLVRDFRPR